PVARQPMRARWKISCGGSPGSVSSLSLPRTFGDQGSVPLISQRKLFLRAPRRRSELLLLGPRVSHPTRARLSVPLLLLMRLARLRSGVSSLFNLTSKKFSVDANWLGHCSTTSGGDAM